MAEDGYEVMGPSAGAAGAPVQIQPPPCPAVLPPPPPPLSPAVEPASDGDKTTPTTNTKKHGKSKKKSKDASSASAYDDTNGKEAFQRPNTCDTLQLAVVSVLLILVLALSIPTILAAKQTMNSDFINKRLYMPLKGKKE